MASVSKVIKDDLITFMSDVYDGLCLRIHSTTSLRSHDEGMRCRLLTLAIFREFSKKLFVLVFACVKAPATTIFMPKQKTQILHEVLWVKGYRVNSLPPASCLQTRSFVLHVKENCCKFLQMNSRQ